MAEENNIEKEYQELNKKNEWQVLYQRIRSQTHKSSSNSCTEATKPENKIFNRYRDVSPYDHSRIVLRRGRTDYINANLIKVKKADRQYILTQGPLSNTLSHFWLMVWEQQTMAIVMLNKLIEKRQDKCHQYWPTKIGPDHKMTLEDVGLTVEYLEQQDHSYYLTRVLRLTDTESGKFRDVLQFHYITWPDFGVPSSPTAFLEFLRKVRDAGVLEADVGPAIVHCSAGIGRSGTFCLVDSCLILIEKFGINSVDVKEVLMEMREYRMGLIQTPEQLRFSYQAIIEGTKTVLNKNIENTSNANNQENELIINNLTNFLSNVSEESDSEIEEDEDEPPPLPPPRHDSLHKYNGENTFDRPLPNIPKSTSDDNLNYDDTKEVTNNSTIDDEISEEDELEEEDDDGEEEKQQEGPDGDNSKSNNSYEVRQRLRQQKRDTMEAQVRDMKRRQQINEQWTQLKRSLYIPLIIGGSLILGGGLIAYIYFKIK